MLLIVVFVPTAAAREQESAVKEIAAFETLCGLAVSEAVSRSTAAPQMLRALSGAYCVHLYARACVRFSPHTLR
jgi:hypothetical protein